MASPFLKKEVFLVNLMSNITEINQIGEKRATLYKKLGIQTVNELIHHFPRSYIDFANASTIDAFNFGDTVTVDAIILEKLPPIKVRSGRTIFRAVALDRSQNAITITFFNNKYAFEALKTGETFIFHGKLSGTFNRPELTSPIYIPQYTATSMQPNYSLTAGLTHKMIASNIRTALKSLGSFPCTSLPDYILDKENLSNNLSAYQDIHFPRKLKDAENAQKLFALEEVLCLQLGMSGLKRRSKKQSQFKIADDDLAPFLDNLPYTPTNAQKTAIQIAIDDFKSGKSMNRLLQGDVGSGKTLVAAASFYIICKNGGQCAFMAPTEILSIQHHKTLSKFLKKFGIKIGILTGSSTASEKRKLYSQIENGEVNVVCGTHALIEKAVNFKNLALVITDEQHRFGVSQRASLISKGNRPHTLIMSATPIPRSLALTIYGDLDISILNELPSGRKNIKTYLINSEKRLRAYSFLEKEILKGHQIYIVCPAVEESELEIEAATEYSEKLKNYLPTRNIGLLHGKMKATEKDDVMSKFCSGEIDILVSTTVIEVGVDVSNATIMMIENAERFGLSQLHQLRGRVGRSNIQSYCILVSDSKGENAVSRLKVMCKTNDGFEIAKQDLLQRGPGDFFGDKQHGLPPLNSASLLSDSRILEKAQTYAAQILEKDPMLTSEEHFELKQKVNSMFEKLGYARNN